MLTRICVDLLGECDPARYRLMMLPSMLEKASFGIAVFLVAFWKTR